MRALGSVEARGSRVVLICIPAARALAGRLLRKSRVARERMEKGLNFVFTSVMKRVIMVGEAGRQARQASGLMAPISSNKVGVLFPVWRAV